MAYKLKRCLASFVVMQLIVVCLVSFLYRNTAYCGVACKEWTTVVAPVRDIKEGEQLRAEDFTLLTFCKRGGYMSHYVAEISDMFAKRHGIVVARRKLIANRPVKKADIANQIVVKKGQRVTLVFRKYNLVLETMGICMMGGAIGDMIRVKAVDTNKILLGEVVDANVIAIIAK